MTIIEPTSEEATQEQPTPQDQQTARAATEQLRRLLESGAPASARASLECRFREEGEEKVEAVALPLPTLRLLHAVLEAHADGHVVTIMPSPGELRPDQAADALGVSRPFLIKLLDEGQIPFRRAGTQRRIRVDALNSYQKQEEERQLEILARLQAQAQALNMGY